MKQKIIDIIYSMSTERGGIYSSLFGHEGLEEQFKYTFNFSFENQYNIEQDIKYFLDNIIAKIISHNDIKKIQGRNKIVVGDFTHSNIFLLDAYKLDPDTKLCDIEYHLDDIEVNEHDKLVQIKWTLPIYPIIV